MSQKVSITDNKDRTVEITVADDEAARQYENLPFEDERITVVTVTDA